MKNVKMDPVCTAMSALFVVASVGLVATLPTIAQPSAQPEARATTPRRAAPQNATPPNGDYGPPDGGPSGPPPCSDGPPPGGPNDNGKAVGRMLGDMVHSLKLDAKQEDNFRTIMESERKQIDALHEQMRKIHEKTRSSVDTLLTAAQRKQLEQMEKQMEANRPAGPPRNGPQDGPNGPPPGGPNQ